MITSYEFCCRLLCQPHDGIHRREYGTVYHQVWHHRQVWKLESLAWKLSCLRDATELTNIDLLCTFITCSWTVCYVPLKFLDYVTLVAIVFIIIINQCNERWVMCDVIKRRQRVVTGSQTNCTTDVAFFEFTGRSSRQVDVEDWRLFYGCCHWTVAGNDRKHSERSRLKTIRTTSWVTLIIDELVIRPWVASRQIMHQL